MELTLYVDNRWTLDIYVDICGTMALVHNQSKSSDFGHSSAQIPAITAFTAWLTLGQLCGKPTFTVKCTYK